MTALDLISGAMRLFGALAQGETPNADEQATGLAALNDLLEEWSTDRLNLFTVGAATHPCTVDRASYTIGPSADWNAPRPVAIQSASILQADTGLRFPLAPLSSLEFGALRDPALVGQMPERYYCDYADPIATLNLYPAPHLAHQVELWSWSPLPAFPDLTTPVAFPRGYAKALRFALAVNLAPEYGAPPDANVVAIAVGARDAIRAINAELLAGPLPAASLPPLPQGGQPAA